MINLLQIGDYMLQLLILNIKSTIRNNLSIILLSCLGITMSIILVFFSFGFIHHLNAVDQDKEFSNYYLGICLYDHQLFSVNDKHWTYEERKYAIENELVKLQDVLSILCKLPKETQDRIDSGYFNIKFKGDVAENPIIDCCCLVCPTNFRIQDNKIVNSKKMLLSDGRYFTKEEEDEGQLVCIECFNKLKINDNRFINGTYYDDMGNPVKDIKLAEKYIESPSKTYLIGGKEYQCIGSADGVFSIPIVPISTLDDNVYVSEIGLRFNRPISRNDYETICERFQEKYGDLMSVYPLEIPEAVTARFSNTLLVICLLIAFLSGSITAFIYQYLLQRSARTFRIYRLCGMSAEQVRLLCFAEFISLQVFSVLIGLLGYHFIIMPILDKSLVYLSDAYNPANYIKLSALYLAISLSIVIFMMNSEEMRNTWVNM